MKIYGFPFLLMLAVPPVMSGQQVRIQLPNEVRSETVQGQYYFLGAGNVDRGAINSPSGLREIRVSTSANMAKAEQFHITLYSPGCDFEIFNLTFADNSPPTVPFTCKPPRNIHFSGQISSALVAKSDLKITILYWGDWIDTRKGDGILPSFDMGSIVPKQDGSFQVDLPDYSGHSGGSFTFRLLDTKSLDFTGNAGFIVPENPEFRAGVLGLRVQPSYPENLRFVQFNETH